MIRKIFFLFFLSSFSLNVLNCVQAQENTVNPPEYPAAANETEVIKAAKVCMDELVKNYNGEHEEDFFRNVSDEYLTSYLDFKIRVENDFRNFDQIRVQYWIDRELAEGKRVSIQIHWEKSTMTPTSGTPVLTRGTTKFIFEVNDGKALLMDQQDAVLFGSTMS